MTKERCRGKAEGKPEGAIYRPENRSGFRAEVKRSVTSAKNASGFFAEQSAKCDKAGTEAQTTDVGSVRKDGDYVVPGGENKDERGL